MKITPNDALIAVDVQNDFCPGGALAVEGGDKVALILSALMPKFKHVIVSRDWHPADHCSFSSKPEFHDGSWPAHCVADTPGAAFHKDLALPGDAIVIDKATRADHEAYSGFDGTDLDVQLHERGVERVFIGGLATDYCVRATVLGASEAGFEVVVIEDACRGVAPETSEEALEEMKLTGATFCTSGEIE